MLKDLRKRNAKKLGVPPFVIFQDPSLEDMALKYPITIRRIDLMFMVLVKVKLKNMVKIL